MGSFKGVHFAVVIILWEFLRRTEPTCRGESLVILYINGNLFGFV